MLILYKVVQRVVTFFWRILAAIVIGWFILFVRYRVVFNSVLDLVLSRQEYLHRVSSQTLDPIFIRSLRCHSLSHLCGLHTVVLLGMNSFISSSQPVFLIIIIGFFQSKLKLLIIFSLIVLIL